MSVSFKLRFRREDFAAQRFIPKQFANVGALSPSRLFSAPQLFASQSLLTSGTNYVTRGKKMAITGFSVCKGKSNDELQAKQERKADTVSRPGGFRSKMVPAD